MFDFLCLYSKVIYCNDLKGGEQDEFQIKDNIRNCLLKKMNLENKCSKIMYHIESPVIQNVLY